MKYSVITLSIFHGFRLHVLVDTRLFDELVLDLGYSYERVDYDNDHWNKNKYFSVFYKNWWITLRYGSPKLYVAVRLERKEDNSGRDI